MDDLYAVPRDGGSWLELSCGHRMGVSSHDASVHLLLLGIRPPAPMDYCYECESMTWARDVVVNPRD
jgi:hypothetical protein